MLIGLAWIVRHEHAWTESRKTPGVSVADARQVFSGAARLGPREFAGGGQTVFDADGAEAGIAVTTSPASDDIIGYSGPTNALIGLDESGAVRGIHILGSGDTPEHVELVKSDPAFAKAFAGWQPGRSAAPRAAAVSGATLTSSAIAEGIERRLAGSAPSLRFPEAVTMAEAREFFPNAAAMTREANGRLRVNDATGSLPGYLVRTAPWSDGIAGYRGPLETLVALKPDGKTIAGLRLRKSFDTAEYVEDVRADDYWMKKVFLGRTVGDVARMNWERDGIEGVSGATQTSYAMAEGMKQRFAAMDAPAAAAKSWRPSAHDVALSLIVIGAVAMAFTHLRGRVRVRRVWQALLIGYVGLASGDLLSLSLAGGWAQHGAAWRAAPGLVFLMAAALILPWAGGRQVYCHHLCPHGAAQQWLGSLRKRKLSLPGWLSGAMEAIPWLLLGGGVLVLVRGIPLDLADIEPFDAWVWRAAGAAAICIAVAGLAASAFIPQAYCRYGCPTGALLKIAWSHGRSDRFGRRDWFALGLFAAAWILRPSLWPADASDIAEFRGRAMGTTWTVKLDAPAPAALRGGIEACLERVEDIASNWRPRSAVSLFNASRIVKPQRAPAELARLVRESQRISEASGGAFDVTAAPLVRAWGFGPGARPGAAPAAAVLAGARRHVGWRKVFTSAGGTLQKRDPDVALDFSAIAKGWAIDEIFALLARRGHARFLVEAGGEMRARGEWQVAIEHPWRIVRLKNAALATSGTYRQHWRDGARERSHLIDPRTGRPVEHGTVSVSVMAATCAEADGWATALNVLGVETGLPLAERRELAAEFICEESGRAHARASSSWPGPGR